MILCVILNVLQITADDLCPLWYPLSTMATYLSRQSVVEALQKVHEPGTELNIFDKGVIKELVVKPDGYVSIETTNLPTDPKAKDQLERAIRQALTPLPGIRQVILKMDGEIRKDSTAGNAAAMSIPGVKRIIAVSSGKGGVGKSTVSVNLAVALARSGLQVGLMDADVYGPNLPTMMGVTEQPSIVDIAGKGEFFVPPVAHGVKVMSMGFLIDPDQPLVWRGPMLHNIMQQFTKQVDWGNLDILVIDMPPGTGDVQLSLAQLVSLDGAILVTTPQEVAMQDVRKAFVMWEKVRVPVIGVVENMSYFQADPQAPKHYIFGQGGGEILAKKFGAKLLAQLPLVQAVREGGDQGQPVTASLPESEIALKFMKLAAMLNTRDIAAEKPGIQIGSF